MRAILENIINNKQITTLFQPIVSLKTAQIVGYEALSRGPQTSPLHSPAQLFTAASTYSLLDELEKICRQQALSTAATYQLKNTIFININPETIKHPLFQASLSKSSITEMNHRPEQIVFEITERTAIDDFKSFRNSINYYRRQGFTIAIDDTGAGYSSLQSIAELNPDYIKIDRSIVEEIDKNPIKQALLTAMLECAKSIKAYVIAEGIETKDELTVLIKLGVDYGQGFLLARPSCPPPQIESHIQHFIRLQNIKQNETAAMSKVFGITIGDIIQYSPTVSPTTLVCEIEELFSDNLIAGVVVVNDTKPIGLVMKNKLYFQLGTNYGVSLYHRRPIKKLMDNKPLIVNADLPLEAVSQMAMNRKEQNIYDFIIVVKDDTYLGTVSIIHLLKHLTNLQIKCAYHANPLTGLPGNLLIEERLKNIITKQQLFAVLYIDLDNFKAFNDKYGFEHGDKVILLTAGILSASVGQKSNSDGQDFIGHIGGDDFIIITHPDNIEKLCETIISMFDQEIASMYNDYDRQKGYIEVKNRRGLTEFFPLMTISIAVVSNKYRKITNYLEVGEIAAEIKKHAKAYHKSIWIADKRS